MISVIIVNYKNENMTVEFVKNELSKISQPYKVIIVNNGATDASDESLASPLNARIIYDINEAIDENIISFVIHNDENLGFAKANNLGACLAYNKLNSDFLLFSNNDIEFIDNNVVESLIEKIEQMPDVGIIGPKVVGVDGYLQSPEPYLSFYQRMILPYIKPLIIWRKDEKKPKYCDIAEEGYHYKLMGSFFLCKAKDYFECGMMDSHTFLYYEENILTERLKSINKLAYYYPKVSVLHAHNQTIGKHTSFKQQRDYMFESGAYFYKTYKNVPSLCIFISWLLKESSKIIGTIKRL